MVTGQEYAELSESKHPYFNYILQYNHNTIISYFERVRKPTIKVVLKTVYKQEIPRRYKTVNWRYRIQSITRIKIVWRAKLLNSSLVDLMQYIKWKYNYFEFQLPNYLIIQFSDFYLVLYFDGKIILSVKLRIVSNKR